MNANTIKLLVARLHRELPQLGSVAVDRCLWTDRETGYNKHINSRYRVSVFSTADNLLDGANLPYDASYSSIEDAIRTIYNTAFTVAQPTT